MCEAFTTLMLGSAATGSAGLIGAGGAVTAGGLFSAASMGLGFVSSMQQAQAARDQANYNAAVARNNATTANYQAQAAIESGRLKEQQHRLKVKNLKGQQTASMAANGIQLGSGTAAEVIGDTEQQGELDARMIAHNAQLEAWGFKGKAANYEADAVGTIAAGKNKATGSLLSGIGTVADKWYKRVS